MVETFQRLPADERCRPAQLGFITRDLIAGSETFIGWDNTKDWCVRAGAGIDLLEFGY